MVGNIVNMLDASPDAGTGNTFNQIFNNNQTNPFRTSNLCEQMTYGQMTVSYRFDANGIQSEERNFEWTFWSSRHFEWGLM